MQSLTKLVGITLSVLLLSLIVFLGSFVIKPVNAEVGSCINDPPYPDRTKSGDIITINNISVIILGNDYGAGSVAFSVYANGQEVASTTGQVDGPIAQSGPVSFTLYEEGQYAITISCEHSSGSVSYSQFTNYVTIEGSGSSNNGGNSPPDIECPPDYPYLHSDNQCWDVPECGGDYPYLWSDGQCYDQPECPGDYPYYNSEDGLCYTQPPEEDFLDIDVPEFETIAQDETAEVDVTVIGGKLDNLVTLTATNWSTVDISTYFDSSQVAPNSYATLYVQTTCKTPPDKYLISVRGETEGTFETSEDRVLVTVVKNQKCQGIITSSTQPPIVSLPSPVKPQEFEPSQRMLDKIEKMKESEEVDWSEEEIAPTQPKPFFETEDKEKIKLGEPFKTEDKPVKLTDPPVTIDKGTITVIDYFPPAYKDEESLCDQYTCPEWVDRELIKKAKDLIKKGLMGTKDPIKLFNFLKTGHEFFTDDYPKSLTGLEKATFVAIFTRNMVIVPEGTEFTVEVNDDETKVTVFEGSVSVLTKDFDEPMVVKANEYAFANSIESATGSIDPSTIDRWWEVIAEEESLTSGGCLIATATYGTELAPQVQQLRELRNNYLLQTASGTSFMAGFNQFYYSFSPTIADWERESPVFKEAVKIMITPMISSLSILNHVNMDSEESVLGYGISLIILNGMMYVGIPIAGIIVIRKKF